MKKPVISLLALLFSLSHSAIADEFTVAVGVFNFAEAGADIQASYRVDQSHWQYGYRYVSWTDTFHDPYTGNAHSKTTETLTGPVVNYLFRNESRHSAYVGVSLLNWTRTETPLLVVAPSDTQSTTDLYFGGGYMGRFGSAGYYNAGMYLSPTAELKTQTAISSSEQSGNFDIQLQVGLTW
ncbi:MAG: hypothetical protein HY799_02545 [Nitrosomonadales bacterium]|nr:hypothetical protein [Nitrosomonadales bacterium]